MQKKYLQVNNLLLNCEYCKAEEYIDTIDNINEREILRAFVKLNLKEFDSCQEILETLDCNDELSIFKQLILANIYYFSGNKLYNNILSDIKSKYNQIKFDYIRLQYHLLEGKKQIKIDPLEFMQEIL